jgi:flagellar capping protein FliD
MISVPDPKELVAKIRKAASERGLSINDIIKLMDEKGYYPCGQATISRLLSGDIEGNYDYLKTIIPVYNTLFVGETENNDNYEAMKELLKYKLEVIQDLKAQLDAMDAAHKEEISRLKSKYHDKMEKETVRFQEIMEFRGNQMTLKDERITQLMADNSKLTDHIVNCPYRGKC